MDFSIAESRFCYKFAEIFSGPFAKDRISRVWNRFSQNDINIPQEKVKKLGLKVEKLMPKAYFKPLSDTLASDQSCRFSLFDTISSTTSYAANQVFMKTANSSYKKQSLLPVFNVSKQGS